MSTPKKSGLGRGLDAIYVDADFSSSEDRTTTLRINEIEPNRAQPRKNFSEEELTALSDSIQKYGVISPIIVRKTGERYTIIAGERRWRASRMAGLNEVPVIIINADDKKAAEMALVENIQRTDLNPVEEGQAYAALMNEYSLTQEQVAERVGKSRSAITNALRIIDLPDKALALLSSGAISPGHAKVLLGIKDKSQISRAAELIVEKDLSVRETEALVKKLNTPEPPAKPADPIDYTRDLERSIEKKLGRTVKIRSGGKHNGITLGFSDNTDLEKILRLLCGDKFVDSL